MRHFKLARWMNLLVIISLGLAPAAYSRSQNASSTGQAIESAPKLLSLRDQTAVREQWLKKSVPLDYPSAVVSLIRFYGVSETPADQQQRYLYARVAAGYLESTKSAAPRDGFDATALQEMEKALSAADRSRVEAEAARILICRKLSGKWQLHGSFDDTTREIAGLHHNSLCN